MTRTAQVGPPPQVDFAESGSSKPMLIGGEWVQAASGETFATVNPANASTITAVASAGAADVDHAVDAARRAFDDPAWSDMNPHQRTRVLLRIAEIIDAHAEELALIESLDVGIPIRLARYQIAIAAETFRYYAGWPTKLLGTVNPLPRCRRGRAHCERHSLWPGRGGCDKQCVQRPHPRSPVARRGRMGQHAR
jgi:acyl-CoA reductase-like NAD-dependent aldehyde dehydrogenase